MDEMKAGAAGASEQGLALAFPRGLLRQIERLASPWAAIDAAAQATSHRVDALRQVTVALNPGVAGVPSAVGRGAGGLAAGAREAAGGSEEALTGLGAGRGAEAAAVSEGGRGRSASGSARAVLQRLGAAATGLRGWMGPGRVAGAARAAGARAGRLDAVSAAPVVVVRAAAADPLRLEGGDGPPVESAWTVAVAPADGGGDEDRGGGDLGALPLGDGVGRVRTPVATAPVLAMRMAGDGGVPGAGGGAAVAPGFEAFVAALGRDTGSAFSGLGTMGSRPRAPSVPGSERPGGGMEGRGDGGSGDGGSGGGRSGGGREEIALVELDGRIVGSILSERMARDATRPGAGMTGFDARQAPAWTPSGSV